MELSLNHPHSALWQVRGITIVMQLTPHNFFLHSILFNPHWSTSSLYLQTQPYHFHCIEYVEQGDLFSFLNQNEFNSDRNLMWARQIAAGKSIHVVTKLFVVMVTFLFPWLIGMKYLHFDVPGREVIHRDLKSTNGILYYFRCNKSLRIPSSWQ